MCKPRKYVSADQQKCLKKYSTSTFSRTWSKQYGLPIAHVKHCVQCKCWRIHAMAGLYLRLMPRVEVGDNEIQTCIYALVITNWKVNRGLTLFAAVSSSPACCIPPNGDASFIASTLQKFLSNNSMNMAVLYISCALKFKHWLRSSSVSK